MRKKSNFVNAFEVITKEARTFHNRFTSQFHLSDVIKFQQGYAVTSNKKVYLGDYGKTKYKPSILDHIEAVVVDILATKNLGFESKEKEKENKLLAVSMRLLHFLNADIKALSHNDSSKFNTPILSGIKHVIVAKNNTPLKRTLKRSILKPISRRVKFKMGCGPVLTTVLNKNVAHWLDVPFLPILTMELVELKHT